MLGKTIVLDSHLDKDEVMGIISSLFGAFVS
jgi:hypothetical protein